MSAELLRTRYAAGPATAGQQRHDHAIREVVLSGAEGSEHCTMVWW